MSLVVGDELLAIGFSSKRSSFNSVVHIYTGAI
jgi:hypothetical protein